MSKSLRQPITPLPLLLLLTVAGVLFALGINPYVMPESTDDIIYYEGAKSLIYDGTYKFNGEIISDWPPVYSLVLAGFFLIFGESLILAKIISAMSALLAFVLAFRLLRVEQRNYAWPAIMVYAFLPTGFLYAIRSASDWTYIALCFAFLLLLNKLAKKPSTGIALLGGVTLGAAALTRHVGVMLGAAVIAQFCYLSWQDFKSRRESLLSAALKQWRHVLLAVLGAGLWFAWGMFLKMSPEGTVARGMYEAHGSSLMNNFQPGIFFFECVGDYFAQLPNIFEKFNLRGGLLETITSTLIGIIICIGLCRSLFAKGSFRATDYFVLAYGFLLVMYEWKLPRFLLPIGPWLLIYFFDGLGWISSKLLSTLKSNQLITTWQPRVLTLIWVTLALAMNLVLIFKGHPGKLHGPLFTSFNTSEREFYGSFYRDLYDVGQLLTKLPKDSEIATQGFFVNYLTAFSNRPCLDPRLYHERDFDVIVDTNSIYEEHPMPEGWRDVHHTENLNIYVRPGFDWETYNPPQTPRETTVTP